MKSYAAYMKEISANEIYEGLLGYGMFSEKLPQIFTSEELLRFNSIGIPERWHSYIRYNSMRNTNVTREIGIPNPIAYMSICSVIKENWDKIQDHFMEKTRGQNHNVSRIHIRKMHGTKSLFKMNYENWKLDGSPEDDLIIGSRYIVRADISKCFPSIYSHSVPWALVGKTEAKCKSSKKYDSCWFNKIDKCSTYCKSGETHGLLIGPHTSSLLAEIILTTIDKELYNKKWRYIRCIDDYTCYVDSMEGAQLFLIALKAELGKFDLSLNDKKTEILALPVANTKQWIRKL